MKLLARLLLALALVTWPVAASAQLMTVGVGAGGAAASAACPSEATAYIAALSPAPSAGRQTLICTLVAGLKTDGVWSKLDWLCIWAEEHNSTNSLVDWAQPSKSAAIFGTMTWTADRGFMNPSGDSAGITIESPLAAGNNATVNSIHISAYINAFAFKDFGGFIVSNGGGQTYLGQDSATQNMRSKIGDNTYTTLLTSSTPSDYLGMYTSTRTGASARAFYFNGASVASDTTAQTGPVNATVRVMAGDGSVNMASPNVAVQAAAFTMGQGLTATDADNLRSRLLTYLTAIGAN